MNSLSRLRPSPAMVVACIALAVALGGTSYAAITLPRNSVGPKQLRKNAVTPVKVKANAITSPKVANNSLTGADVNEGSLGQVPSALNATNAINAVNSANSTNAVSAANAANANTLGGIPVTGFLRSGNEGGGALAGANVTAGGTVNAYFNRFGGAPSVSHNPGLGTYTITFPGLQGKLHNYQVIHVATLLSSGQISVASQGGNPHVVTFNSAGTQADRGFFYTVFGSNVAPTP